MSQADQVLAGLKADELISNEVAIQDRMWGEANERADATESQLMHAAVAQLVLLDAKLSPGDAVPLEDVLGHALNEAAAYYPDSWSGLRDYGSNIANLVVAAAFIRSEVKRRLLLGEDTTRSKRQPDQSYDPVTGLPYVSSEQAAVTQ